MIFLSRYWWVLTVRGLAAIAFGIAALVWPGITLLTLIYLFGAFALVDGVFSVAMGINHVVHRDSHVWSSLLQGLAGIIVGILAFAFPGWTALAFVFLIAAWAIVTACWRSVPPSGCETRSKGNGSWDSSGVLDLLFGLVLTAFPRTGALAVIWIIGAFSVVAGVSLVFLSVRLRGLRRERVPQATRRAAAL